MGSDKTDTSDISRNKLVLVSSYFSRNKQLLYILLILFFLAIFPFLIYKIISATFGLIELNQLENKKINTTPEYILGEISNYYKKYGPNLNTLNIQLDALDMIKDPSLKVQIQKIRLINTIQQESWFSDPNYHQRLAKILYDMAYYQEALHHLKVYMEQNQNFQNSTWKDSQAMLYNISMLSGDYKQAIGSAQAILDLFPDDQYWSLELALSYTADQQYVKARIELETLLFKDNDPVQHFKILFSLIDILYELKLHDRIDFYLHYIVTAYSTTQEKEFLLSSYAKYLIKKGDEEQALKKWQVSYNILNPQKRNKNLKNNFDKYLKS